METLRIDQEWLEAAARGLVVSISTDEGTEMLVIVEEPEEEEDFWGDEE